MTRTKQVLNSQRTCPLRDDYRSWSEDKKRDRLFMSCPSCGVYGSHVSLYPSPPRHH